MAKKLDLKSLKEASIPFEVTIPAFLMGDEEVIVTAKRVNIRDVGVRISAQHKAVRNFIESGRLPSDKGKDVNGELKMTDEDYRQLMPLIEAMIDEGLVEPKYSEIKEVVGDLTFDQKAVIFVHILAKSVRKDTKVDGLLAEMDKNVAMTHVAQG